MTRYKIKISEKMKRIGYRECKTAFLKREQCEEYGRLAYNPDRQNQPDGWEIIEVIK